MKPESRKFKWSILFFLFVVLFFAGCQTTPEKTVIKSKSAGEYALAQPDAEVSPSANIDSQTRYEKWQESFESMDGTSNISINADIVVNLDNNYSVIDISPMALTPEYVKGFFEAVCYDSKLLRDDNIKSKKEIEALVFDYRRIINDEKSKPLGEADDSLIDSYEFQIRELEQQYEKAPDEIVESSPDFIFVDEPEGQSIRALAITPMGETVRLYAFRNESNKGNMFLYHTDRGISAIKSVDQQHEQAGISFEDARDQAMDIIERTGLGTDFRLAAQYSAGDYRNPTDYVERGYILYFTRTINGKHMTYVKTQDGTNAYYDSSIVDEPWPDEVIEIGIDEKGIASLVWTSPSTLDINNTQKASVLNIDELEEITKEQLVKKYIKCDPHYDIQIHRIELGYSKIKDQTGIYVVIPVWDVFGTIDMKFDVGSGQYNPLNSGNFSLITINAIDGSIIDRGLMY